MARILVVDDHAHDRYLLAALFTGHGHEITEAANGEEALAAARSQRPDLIVTDVMMPVMDGFELCARLRDDQVLSDTPVMIYSATYTRPDEKNFAIATGANAYLQKPAETARLVQAAEALLSKPRPAKHIALDTFSDQHRKVLLRKLEQKVNELQTSNQELQASEQRVRTAMAAMVETVARMIEYRDPYTAGHQRRVGLMGSAIGRQLGLDARRIEGLLYGGYVHDVGKIGAPAEILTRPGRLSAVEKLLVHAHPRVGYEILRGIDFPWPVAMVALQHHERMDGSGYPDGVVGEAILLEARIIAVADVVESMATHRPYRPSLGLEPALQEIENGAGKLYDRDVVAACLRLFREQRYQLPN